MAILLMLLALFGFVVGGFGSGSSHATSPQRFKPTPGTAHVQKSVTRSHVTVRSTATATGTAKAKSSVSCTASTRIKGASVQTSRHCRYSPVIP
jgi:hypothetical protein